MGDSWLKHPNFNSQTNQYGCWCFAVLFALRWESRAMRFTLKDPIPHRISETWSWYVTVKSAVNTWMILDVWSGSFPQWIEVMVFDLQSGGFFHVQLGYASNYYLSIASPGAWGRGRRKLRVGYHSGWWWTYMQPRRQQWQRVMLIVMQFPL
jgi:hypothetical protein